MTPESFRRIALGMFAAEEGTHMGHPDFRVGGRIFASLPPARPDEPRARLGMVRVPPAVQADLIRQRPEAFTPGPGAWGRQGCTFVRLSKVRAPDLRRAMHAAWHAAAPERILRAIETIDG